ncbi:MAG: uracil phosphoribosyltransferase, partial [Microcoleus sp.]
QMAIEYYFKVPLDIEQRDVLIVDPMLATGNSAVAAVDRLKEVNPKSIKFLCLLAAPEGIEHFQQQHPDVQIYTAAIDERAFGRSRIYCTRTGRCGRWLTPRYATALRHYVNLIKLFSAVYGNTFI